MYQVSPMNLLMFFFFLIFMFMYLYTSLNYFYIENKIKNISLLKIYDK